MTFPPEWAGAIVVPAHPTNVLRPVNDPKVLVDHTPEEPADERETTPYFFQTPNLGASTHYYGDNDGDMFQMVPELNGAIANGVGRGFAYPAGTVSTFSLNYQSLSCEWEGFAASIRRTMRRGGPQWVTAVAWRELKTRENGIPLDLAHVIGHSDVAAKGDPGTLDRVGLMNDAIRLRQRLVEGTDYVLKEFVQGYKEAGAIARFIADLGLRIAEAAAGGRELNNMEMGWIINFAKAVEAQVEAGGR